MYEFAVSKSAKLVVREYGKLVARILQSIALLARVRTLLNPHTYFAGFAVFYSILYIIQYKNRFL
jgi:hypothetical protein